MPSKAYEENRMMYVVVSCEMLTSFMKGEVFSSSNIPFDFEVVDVFGASTYFCAFVVSMSFDKLKPGVFPLEYKTEFIIEEGEKLR